MKKYEFTDKEIKHLGKTLKQIVCVTAFASISVGDIGGYVESESNLSHAGDAWVCGNAQVFGNARVHGDAWVFGNAQVYGNARVHGDAWVFGNAQVYGDAQVCGNAKVYGDARVCGNAKVCGNAQVFGNANATSKAKTISTNHYHVTISDTHICIGCQNHPIEFWKKQNKDSIAKLDSKESGELWEKYGEFILMLADEGQHES